MLTSIGHCITLTTHANAALAGHEVDLDLAAHPGFEPWSEYLFGIGEDRSKVIGTTFSEWTEFLGQAGFTRAYLWIDPFSGQWDTINGLAFAGGERWAPVTADDASEVIWHDRSQYDEANPEHPWRTWRGGFRIMPGQISMQATPEEAARSLDAALAALSEFQLQYRPAEPFHQMFDTGRLWLASSGLLEQNALFSDGDLVECTDSSRMEMIRGLFPASLYPRWSTALAAAVSFSWALRGMGWWTDWSSADFDLEEEFRRRTGDYYVGLVKCLYAACNVRLGG